MDAEAYIEWLNRKTQMNFKLPTEADWERAARGADGRIYPWGDDADPARANVADTPGGPKAPMPVTAFQKGASPYRAVNMVGNVAEWIDAGIVNIVGGCCGSTPDHIAALRDLVEGRVPRQVPAPAPVTHLAGLDAMALPL